jgi:ferritin-like metal-binding protein YciE
MKQGQEIPLPSYSTTQEVLQPLFFDTLNRVYCAKSHLAERLSEVVELVNLADLKQAILGTLDELESQLDRMDELYKLLGLSYSFNSCNGIIAIFENAFSSIDLQGDNVVTRDLSILFYLLHVESIELASFQTLEVLSSQLEENRVKQILRENFEEAKADKALMLMIATKYIRNISQY